MDSKKMTGNSSKCLRDQLLDASPCHHTSSIFCDHCLVTSCEDPPGELNVYRGKGGAKGKSILFPPQFFSGSSSIINAYYFGLQGEKCTWHKFGIFSVFRSSPLFIRLHPASGSVYSLEQGLIAHIQMATSGHHLCSTALSVTKYSNDFKRRPITNLPSFPGRFSPD